MQNVFEFSVIKQQIPEQLPKVTEFSVIKQQIPELFAKCNFPLELQKEFVYSVQWHQKDERTVPRSNQIFISLCNPTACVCTVLYNVYIVYSDNTKRTHSFIN